MEQCILALFGYKKSTKPINSVVFKKKCNESIELIEKRIKHLESLSKKHKTRNKDIYSIYILNIQKLSKIKENLEKLILDVDNATLLLKVRDSLFEGTIVLEKLNNSMSDFEEIIEDVKKNTSDVQDVSNVLAESINNDDNYDLELELDNLTHKDIHVINLEEIVNSKEIKKTPTKEKNDTELKTRILVNLDL